MKITICLLMSLCLVVVKRGMKTLWGCWCFKWNRRGLWTTFRKSVSLTCISWLSIYHYMCRCISRQTGSTERSVDYPDQTTSWATWSWGYYPGGVQQPESSHFGQTSQSVAISQPEPPCVLEKNSRSVLLCISYTCRIYHKVPPSMYTWHAN